jgi:NitT/TauT family transport system substrate-binding protein
MVLRHGRLALVLAVLAVAAGCGGEEDDRARSTQPTLVRVGILPVANAASLYLGMEQGFFADEGINVRPQATSGGAAIIAGVLDQSLQLGMANAVSVLVAAGQGRPVTIVGPAASGGRTPAEAWAQLVVVGDGPVQNVRDLEGRRVGVNLRRDISELSVGWTGRSSTPASVPRRCAGSCRPSPRSRTRTRAA